MKKRIAVVYFSVYGNTKTLASAINKKLEGDLIEIKPITKYDSDKSHYEILTKFAEIEKNENHRPEIEKIDISDYDIIFLGYPIWWYTMPMCVFTFLENNNFDNKTIIPFCTHEGSRESTTYDEIKEKCPNAKVLQGLEIMGSKMVYDHTEEIEKWINELGI